MRNFSNPLIFLIFSLSILANGIPFKAQSQSQVRAKMYGWIYKNGYNAPSTLAMSTIGDVDIALKNAITGEVIVAISDSTGYYEIEVEPGNYFVTVNKTNYIIYDSEEELKEPFQLKNSSAKPVSFFLSFFEENEEFNKSGFTGSVEDDSGGKNIPNAKLIFTSEDGSIIKTVYSMENGRFIVYLPPARYRVVVTHPYYQEYNTGRGFNVVSENNNLQSSNFNLVKK